MELHKDSGSLTPDRHRDSRPPANAAGPARRLWRAPAVAASTALVAALCLYTGSAAHATTAPAAANVSALSMQAAAQSQTTGQGGVHGAFDLYHGSGGGIEFWFNPSTGSLTVAVGTGVGALGGGVLGTYTYGTAPAAGTYLYTDANLAAGTVVTLNLAGTYQLVNGVFSGSVSATVEGRTLTIASNGSSTFTATVTIATNAVGWSGPNYYYDYSFYFLDVEDYLIPTMRYDEPDDYTLVDTFGGNTGTTVYSDANGTDGTVISSDGSSTDGSSVSSDDSSSDDGNSGDDAGDGGNGGGGGGGTGDDSNAPIMEE